MLLAFKILLGLTCLALWFFISRMLWESCQAKNTAHAELMKRLTPLPPPPPVMKITIEAPAHPTLLPTVWTEGKRLAPPAHNIFDPCGWSDDALAALLGEKGFARYEAGTYAFTLTKSHYQLIAGLRAPASGAEIRLQSAAKG